MIITDLNIQNILRAYCRQLSVRTKNLKDKNEKSYFQKDQVSLSSEGKKMWVIDKIAKEIVTQLANNKERPDISKEILNRLCEEYGHPLEVIKDDGKGIIFKMIDDEKEPNSLFLSPTENEKLEKRLYEITKDLIYKQLI